VLQICQIQNGRSLIAFRSYLIESLPFAVSLRFAQHASSLFIIEPEHPWSRMSRLIPITVMYIVGLLKIERECVTRGGGAFRVDLDVSPKITQDDIHSISKRASQL
jgi:hypothetical protein